MFSFDATPMAPIDMKCMLQIKPNYLHTWVYHSMKVWYYVPALNHYRCICAITEEGAVRVTDTFKFIHHTLPIPKISQVDRFVKATRELALTIQGHIMAPPDELKAIEHL